MSKHWTPLNFIDNFNNIDLEEMPILNLSFQFSHSLQFPLVKCDYFSLSLSVCLILCSRFGHYNSSGNISLSHLLSVICLWSSSYNHDCFSPPFSRWTHTHTHTHNGPHYMIYLDRAVYMSLLNNTCCIVRIYVPNLPDPNFNFSDCIPTEPNIFTNVSAYC